MPQQVRSLHLTQKPNLEFLPDSFLINSYQPTSCNAELLSDGNFYILNPFLFVDFAIN